MAKHPIDPSAIWTSKPLPTFEHARVADAMRHGLIECHPETLMQTVARILANYHVHSVIVTVAGDGTRTRPWGIVTDSDVLRAAGSALDVTAGACATTEVVTVAPNDSLKHAAELMLEHDASHLVVVDPENERPLGVLSTLDISRLVGWGIA